MNIKLKINLKFKINLESKIFKKKINNKLIKKNKKIK
jgi:hypothetical protein